MNPEMNLVLVGKTEAGKSATGNTILGKKCFNDEASMSSVTQQCQMECEVVQGRSLALIDTPGLYNTDLSQNEVKTEVLRCLKMCSPGPHAFLLIIPIARFTEQHLQSVDLIEKIFEENLTDHTIIIFTHADELKGQTIEDYISEQNQKIKNVVERFGGRFLAFNNKDTENQDQVTLFLQKLDELMKRNEYRHFTNQETQIVEKAVKIMENYAGEKINEVNKETEEEIKKGVTLFNPLLLFAAASLLIDGLVNSSCV